MGPSSSEQDFQGSAALTDEGRYTAVVINLLTVQFWYGHLLGSEIRNHLSHIRIRNWTSWVRDELNVLFSQETSSCRLNNVRTPRCPI